MDLALRRLKRRVLQSIFDDANEAYTARYNHETIALAFSITEEAIEDNLYDRLGSRIPSAWLVQWLTPSKLRPLRFLTMRLLLVLQQVVTVRLLCAIDHPLTNGGTLLTSHQAADLNETSLEDALDQHRWFC